MSKVTLLIGLPGSGKTTYFNTYLSSKVDFIFEDWMGWDVWFRSVPPKNKFNEEPRYNALINRLNNNEYVVLSSIRFCNHKFLCKAEYYLKSQFPNIEIERIYFENDPKKSSANVLYRDNLNGGYLEKDKNGNFMYFGHHYNGIRCYHISLENIKIISPNYIIPNKYTPIPIQVQNETFFQGPDALIKEYLAT